MARCAFHWKQFVAKRRARRVREQLQNPPSSREQGTALFDFHWKFVACCNKVVYVWTRLVLWLIALQNVDDDDVFMFACTCCCTCSSWIHLLCTSTCMLLFFAMSWLVTAAHPVAVTSSQRKHVPAPHMVASPARITWAKSVIKERCVEYSLIFSLL